MFKLLALAVATCSLIAAQPPLLSVDAQQYQLRIFEKELSSALARYAPGSPAIRTVEELIVHADAQLRQDATPVEARDMGARTLDALRRDFARMQTVYASSHPEVRSLQALIAQFERIGPDKL